MNLHPAVVEADLNQLFSTIAPVKFAVIELKTNGESSGIAFVGFEDPSYCSLAVEKFDGRKAAGQIISVENAVPLAQRIGLPTDQNDDIPYSFKNDRSHRKLSARIGNGPGARISTGAGVSSNKGRKITRKTLEELDAELNNYMGGESTTTEQGQIQEQGQANVQVQEQEQEQQMQDEQLGDPNPAFPSTDGMTLD
ncbi:hypothetical protein CANARDRAFT_177051 [[Candida] arabinofermentans NRRL YB-2248]|uniref:RRM domain-containing protein n=1 Tax=[Candida] arabinofermentans NRRL YB-2248 TaxID=983967 RepID=A0A1E4SXK5_9ASCO|nr:hypothetical protein CANARDRAFT_177051 [[Candida] arabinofermentans NRRL YB-2248]